MTPRPALTYPHDLLRPPHLAVDRRRSRIDDAGSEIVFTLYRLPRVTDEEFEKDAEMVRDDLPRLKQALEG